MASNTIRPLDCFYHFPFSPYTLKLPKSEGLDDLSTQDAVILDQPSLCHVGEVGTAGREPCLSPGAPRDCIRENPHPLNSLSRLELAVATSKKDAYEMRVSGDGGSDVCGIELVYLFKCSKMS
jgi:hypothetical protein